MPCGCVSDKERRERERNPFSSPLPVFRVCPNRVCVCVCVCARISVMILSNALSPPLYLKKIQLKLL